MNDFTILIAHPDDEALFCWPALESAKKIVCASSDRNNPSRTWCRDRRLCLEEVGRQLGVEVVCFDADSEFYRMPTRGGELKRFAQQLIAELHGPVFTHNQWGEYGHLDHILCHQIARASGSEVWTSDIATEINWLPIGNRDQKFPDRKQIDADLFDKIKAIYDARGCWTWSFSHATECGIGRVC